jgi:hypothetical protein
VIVCRGYESAFRGCESACLGPEIDCRGRESVCKSFSLRTMEGLHVSQTAQGTIN